jgi:hypothetical protein
MVIIINLQMITFVIGVIFGFAESIFLPPLMRLIP